MSGRQRQEAMPLCLANDAVASAGDNGGSEGESREKWLLHDWLVGRSTGGGGEGGGWELQRGREGKVGKRNEEKRKPLDSVGRLERKKRGGGMDSGQERGDCEKKEAKKGEMKRTASKRIGNDTGRRKGKDCIVWLVKGKGGNIKKHWEIKRNEKCERKDREYKRQKMRQGKKKKKGSKRKKINGGDIAGCEWRRERRRMEKGEGVEGIKIGRE